MEAARVPARSFYESVERLVRLVRLLGEPGEISSAAGMALGRLEREGPLALGELARAERVSQPSMTQLISRLERAGLVRRGPDAGDRRLVLVALTEEGATALARRREERVAALQPLLDRLAPADRHALAAALGAIDRLISTHQEHA